MIKEAKNTRENPAQPVVTETIIQQEDTIDLVELFWVLVNHWKIILLTMLITAMLAGVYYLVGVKPSYQADASIFITNNESVITVSDLQLEPLEGSLLVKANEASLTALDPTGNEIRSFTGKKTEKGIEFSITGEIPAVQYYLKVEK